MMVSERPRVVWETAGPLAGTVGDYYLASRLGPLWKDGGAPAGLRWLPLAAARGIDQQLPPGAAGALVYRYAVRAGEHTRAAVIEAVNSRGERVPFSLRGRDFAPARVAVRGSDFTPARVFVIRTGGPLGGVFVADDPLDALAVNVLAVAQVVPLGAASVIAAPAGVERRIAALADWPGPVVIFAHSPSRAPDDGGKDVEALMAAKRDVHVRRAPPGLGWVDVVEAECANGRPARPLRRRRAAEINQRSVTGSKAEPQGKAERSCAVRERLSSGTR